MKTRSLKSVLFLGALFIAITVQGFQSDSLLLASLSDTKYEIGISSDGRLEKTGGELLLREAKNSNFFLIGEGHGTAEVPKFTSALLRDIGSMGYKYYATEVGPVTASIMSENLREKSADEAMSELLSEFPWSIPFFNWKNEGEVLSVLKDQTGLETNNLWGLDQEFIISSRLHLQRLAQIAPNEEARKMADDYLHQATASFEQALKTKAPMVFMATARPDDFRKLRDAFSNSQDAQMILDELEESQLIYAKIMGMGLGFESNQDRANLMKRHFMTYYQQAMETNENPKVMVKLGANHIYKGYNTLGAMDIGNFVSELAASKNQKSFHLYIVPQAGFQNGFTVMSRSEDDKQKAVDNNDDPTFQALIKVANGEMCVFDLHPLRNQLFNRKLKDVDSDLVKIIYSYDAIMVLPKVTASIDY